jgi:hypothetical protein
MRYEKIEINGKESLPTKTGWYICAYKDGTTSASGGLNYTKSIEGNDESWLKLVDWYLQPLPQTEISDDLREVMQYIERHIESDTELTNLKSLWNSLSDIVTKLDSQLSRIEPEKSVMEQVREVFEPIQLGQNSVVNEAMELAIKKSGKEQPVSEPESISAEEIYKWLRSKNYQTEYEETGEYKMYFEVDMPKILEEYAKFKSGGK